MTRETGGPPSGPSAAEAADGTVADVDSVAAAVGEGVYRLDAEGRFVAVNDVVVDVTGYDRDALLGEHVSLVLDPADVEAFEVTIRELLVDEADAPVGDVEFEIETASGERVVCEARFAVVEADGQFEGTVGVLRDVTERAAYVESVLDDRSQLESELEAVLGRISDAFFALDGSGRVTYVNERAAELLGRDRASLLGESVEESLPEGAASPFVQNALEAMETGEPDAFEAFYRPRSTWFAVRLYPGAAGVSVYFEDVTARKHREAVLERYERIVETVELGIYAADADYRFTMVNDAYCAMTGFAEEELLGEPVSTVVDGETVERGRRLRRAVRAAGESSGSAEVEMTTADGERLVVEADFSLLFGPDGEPQGTVGVVHDVTERTAYEETLRALHGASRRLLEAESVDGVDRVVIDTLVDVLDLPAATLLRYDEATDALVPQRRSGGDTPVGELIPSLPATEESLAGHVFRAGTFHNYDDVLETGYIEDPVTAMRSALYAPLGDYGLLIVDSTETGAFDDRTAQLVELLASNAEAAYEARVQANERARSEQRYRTLVEHFPNGSVALLDEDLQYLAIGGDVYDDADWSVEDAIGTTLDERVPPDVFDRVEPAIRGTFEGTASTFEIEIGDHDFWIHTVPVRDDDGDVVAGMVMSQEVTERKAYERRLELYERIVETVDDGVYVLDGEGRFRFVNEAYATLTGYDREALLGAHASTVTSEENLAEVESIAEALADSAESVATVELEVRTAAGERLPVETRFGLFPLEGGGPGRVGVMRDLTEREERTRALLERERRLSTLMDNVPGIVYRCREEPDWPMEFVSNGCHELTGYRPEQLERGDVSFGRDLVLDADRERLVEEMERQLDDDDPFVVTYRIQTADGDVRWVRGRGSRVVDEETGEAVIEGVIIDVTDQMEYERRLEESEQRYRTIAEHFPNGIVALYDDDLEITLMEGQLMRGEDAAPEEFEGRPLLDVLDAETAEDLEGILRGALVGETDSVEQSIGDRIYDVWATPVRDEHGEVFAGMGFALDVTERREYERELERYEQIVETVDDGVYVLDTDGRFVLVNDAMVAMTAFERAELLGAHGSTVFGEEFEAIDAEHADAIRRGERDFADFEEVLYRADGEEVTVENRFTVFDGDGLQGRVGVVRDITRRKAHERELEKFRTIVENVNDGVYTIDASGHITMANEAYARMMGYDREELVGMHAEALVDGDTAAQARDLEASLLDGAVETASLSADLKTRDGRTVVAEATFATLPFGDDDYERVAVVRDVTERVEREAELERALDLLDRAEAIADVAGWEIDPETMDLYWTERLFHLLGMADREMPSLDDALDVYLEADRGTVEAALEEAIETGEPFDLEVRFLRGGDEQRWARIWCVPEVEDGTVVTLRGAFQDITARIERERELRSRIEQLAAVTELGTLALERHDLDGLFERATRLVTETLDNDLCKLLELQPDGDSMLLRAGTGWDDGLVGTATLGTEDDSIAGRTLQTEEPIVVDDLEEEPPETRPELLTDHGGRSGVSVIIGSPSDPWGVIGTYATAVRAFSERDVNFVQSVANTLGIAIDRRERELEIEDQRNQMAAIVRLSEVVNDINQAVIQQPSREEVTQLVCDRLVEADEYGLAWIGDVNVATERVTPRAAAGIDLGDLEPIPFHPEANEDGLDPTVAAVHARATRVAHETPGPIESESMPPLARERGFHSTIAIPIAFEDIQYGVLTLFAADENAFEGYEETLLEQLSATVGHAINAIDRKQALVSDAYTELEVRLPGLVDGLADSGSADLAIEVVGTVPASDDTVIQYVTVSGGAPGRFAEAARQLPTVTDVRQISGGADDQARFEVVYSDPPLSSTLATYGGRVDSIRFDVPDLRIAVALPRGTDVRKIVETIRTEFPDVRVDAQRTVTRDGPEREERRDVVESALTERQRAAVMTAYFAGYFEWSRESTGEEVAETLGISPSTFHQHLRAAERKVFASLFDDETYA